MASWAELRGHVTDNYKIADDQGAFMKLIFGLPGGRSQTVFVRHLETQDGEHWTTVESPIGNINQVHLPAVLESVSETVCGGLSSVGDLLTLRDAFPLANLDVNEFEDPLRLITTTADRLEAQHFAGDAY